MKNESYIVCFKVFFLLYNFVSLNENKKRIWLIVYLYRLIYNGFFEEEVVEERVF